MELSWEKTGTFSLYLHRHIHPEMHSGVPKQPPLHSEGRSFWVLIAFYAACYISGRLGWEHPSSEVTEAAGILFLKVHGWHLVFFPFLLQWNEHRGFCRVLKAILIRSLCFTTALWLCCCFLSLSLSASSNLDRFPPTALVSAYEVLHNGWGAFCLTQAFAFAVAGKLKMETSAFLS